MEMINPINKNAKSNALKINNLYITNIFIFANFNF